jgi:hypothetical protein
VEWDPTQRGVNHAPTASRNPAADFGLDVLALPRKRHHRTGDVLEFGAGTPRGIERSASLPSTEVGTTPFCAVEAAFGEYTEVLAPGLSRLGDRLRVDTHGWIEDSEHAPKLSVGLRQPVQVRHHGGGVAVFDVVKPSGDTGCCKSFCHGDVRG